MELDIEYHMDKMMPYFENTEWLVISEFFETLEFKYNKSVYHMNQIQGKIEQTSNLMMEDYYEKVNLPLYYELESFLVSIRSSIDIVMHLLNQTLRCGLNNVEVGLSKIYHHRNVNKDIKNILHRYTHNRENDTWSFIYKQRNEIVHEKSINQSLPLMIDVFQENIPTVYFEIEGQQRNVVTFLTKAMSFLGRFLTHLFEAIVLTMEKRKRLNEE